MTGRVSAFLTDEGGTTLPEVLISVLVNAVVISIIATAIVTFTFMQGLLAENVGVSSEMAVTETHWRADVGSADAVTVINESAVSFIEAMPDGTCSARNWSLVDVAGVAELLRENITYSGEAILASGVCAGAETSSMPLTLLSNIEPGTLFSFANLVGRNLTPTSGTGMSPDGDEVTPTGVDSELWADTTVGRATLTATAVNAELRTSQVIVERSPLTATPDAPTIWVAP